MYAFVGSYGPPWRSRFSRSRKKLLLHKRTQRRHGTHKNSRNREGDVALQFGDGQVAPDQSGKISSPVHSRNVYQLTTKCQHRWLDTGTHARKVRKCVRPDWQAEGFVDGEELKTKCPVEGLLHPNRMHRNTDSSQTRVAVSTQASLLWKTPQTIRDIPDACHRWQRG